jgi:hypothetical protein
MVVVAGHREIPAGELAADLDRLAARVNYLQAHVLSPGATAVPTRFPSGSPAPATEPVHALDAAEPVQGTWLPATDLLAADGPLVRLLGPDRVRRFAIDRRVAASSFFQGAALRVLGTGIGLWLSTGRAPDVAAEATAYTLQVDLPAALGLVASEHADGYAAPKPAEGLVVRVAERFEWFVERAFAGHLEPLARAVRRQVRIGERLLWGNAAAAVAAVVLDLERTASPDDRPALREEARRLVSHLPQRLDSLGTWLDVPAPAVYGTVAAASGTVAAGVRMRTFWVRRTCCLWYLEDPERRMCDTCNLLPSEERYARLARHAARRDA